jgi:hypothetical protein
LVCKKFIKRGGKLHGPYYYESYRDESGKIKKRYLGTVNPKTVGRSYFLPLIIISLILVFGVFFFVSNITSGDGLVKSFGVTGKMLLSDEGSSDVFSASDVQGLDNEKSSSNNNERGYLENNEDSFRLSEDEKILSKEDGRVDELIVGNEDSSDDLVNDPINGDTTDDNDLINDDNDETDNDDNDETDNISRDDKKNETGNLTNIIDEDIGEIIDGNLTEDNNRTEEFIESNFSEALEVSIYNSGIVINQPVRWVKSVRVEKNNSERVVLEIPKLAKNITIKTDDKANELIESIRAKKEVSLNQSEKKIISITGMVTREGSEGLFARLFRWIRSFTLTGKVIGEDEIDSVIVGDNKKIDLTDLVGSSKKSEAVVAVEYFTDAPVSVEEKTKRGKRITISADSSLGYENILAYTEVDNHEFSKIRLLNNDEKVDFDSFDLDDDGLVDYIEWVVPHLSTQVYELIIEITSAEHLDENRSFVADIYEQVRDLDDVWSPEISDGEFVRVVFERELTNVNDITIFARVLSGEPRVEIYEIDGEEVIAEFEYIIEEELNRVYLDGLTGEQDSFDLKIVGGSLEFDWIVDPYIDTGELIQSVDDCGDLNTTNAVYTLTQNVTSVGTCFNILANNVTLDCQGHEINYSSAGVLGYGVNVSGYNHPTIRNCVIKESVITTSEKFGIRFSSVNHGSIVSNTIRTRGSNSDSIRFISSANNTILGNDIVVTSTSLIYPVYIMSGINNNVSYNLITVTNNGYGIRLASSSNYISSNIITNADSTSWGIIASHSVVSPHSNVIINNSILSSAGGGIFISGELHELTNNQVNTSQGRSYVVSGTTAAHYNHTVDTSNLAQGKPLLYNYSVSDTVVLNGSDNQYGQIICAWCNNVTYDNVTMGGDGINFFNTSNSNILNSIINTSVGRGIWLLQNSNSNNISGNNVTTWGTNGHAIYLQTNSNSNILFDNDVTTWGSNGIGIYLATADSNNITNNRIETNTGTSSRGLYISTGSNNYVSDTNITCNAGINGAGCLELYPSNDGYFNNVIMNSGGQGLYIRKSGTGDSNYFENSYFKGGTFGFFTVGSPLNTTFRNCVFNATTRPIDPYMGTPTIYVIDSILVNRSSAGDSVYVRSEVTGGEWNFTNVTREDGSPITVNWESGALGTLNHHWWADSNVTAANVPIEGALISASDKDSSLRAQETTNASGRSRMALLEYSMTGPSDITYYNNYSLETTKEGYLPDVQSFNLTETKNLQHEVELDGGNFVMIDSCQDLNQTDAIYLLTANVTSSATCFNILANNVTLDCQGHEINYSSAGVLGYGVNVTGYNWTTVRGCVIKEGVSTTGYKHAIRFVNSTNGNVSNNFILTLGGDSYGIGLFSSSNFSVSNNLVLTNGSYAYAISLREGSNYSFVTDNSILTYNQYSNGVYMVGGEGNMLFNNTISTDAQFSSAILSYQSFNSSILNNTIETFGRYADGIVVQESPNFNSSGNIILTSGNESSGIWIRSSLNNILEENNATSLLYLPYRFSGSDPAHYYHIVQNNIADGKQLYYFKNVSDMIIDSIDGQTFVINSNNITISNSNFTNQLSLFYTNSSLIVNNSLFINKYSVSSIGFSSSHKSLISNNTILTGADYSYGVFLLDGSTLNNILDNRIMTSGRWAYGIYFSSNSNSNSALNNIISTTGSSGYGLSLSSSSNSTISNNTITTSGSTSHGVYFISSTNYNTFRNMRIFTNNSNAHAVRVHGTTHNFTMVDSVLNSTNVFDFYRSSTGNGGIWNLTNVTRVDGASINVGYEASSLGTLNYGWWIDANVSASGSALSGASVIVRDKDSNLFGDELTNVSGRARVSAWEYTRSGADGATWTWYSNYSVNVSKEGYVNSSASYNLTIEGNVWGNFVLEGGEVSDDILIDSCQELDVENGSYKLMNDVTSNATCFNIMANNVTLDCQGYWINYTVNNSFGYGIDNTGGYDDITIRNCGIYRANSSNYPAFRHPVVFSNSNNCLIQNNTLRSAGGYGTQGIVMTNSVNCTIEKNDVFINNPYNNGVIQISGFNNIIRNNTINTGSDSRAIGIVSTSYGDRIEYNIINESASTGRPEGIRLSSNYTILIGNQINLSRGEAISIGTFNYSAANITLGPDNLVNGLPINYTQHIDDLVYDGIDNDYGQVVCINCKNFTIKNSNLSFNPPTCVVCPNFTFYNNTVNSNGFGLLISLSNYSNVTLNEIRHKAMHGYGINIFSSNFSTIRDNSFATSASRESSYYAHSVYVSSSSGLEIENNFISNTGFRASGIYLASSSNNNVSSNQITISQSDSVNADGTLYISASHNNNFFNNTLNSLATRISGVRFGSATRNNTFENNFIYTKNSLSYPIHINGNSHNFSFVNNVLNNSYEDVHFYVSSTAQGIFNFTNVTREDGSPITVNWQSGANGTLNMHWYLDANVTSSGNALENANVSSYDVNDVLSNTSLTDVQGRTRHVLLEMTMNSSTGEAPTITYYNNYSLNVSKEGYVNSSASYNLTIEGNVWGNFVLEGGEVSDDILIDSCQELDVENGSYKLMNDVTSNATCFNIMANNVTLDCQGYWINYTVNNSFGYGIDNTGGYDDITIRNCGIYRANSSNYPAFRHPVVFSNSNNCLIQNNTLRSAGGYGTQGIVMTNSVNCTIEKNDVFINNPYNNGVIQISGFNNIIRNNTINTGSDSRAIGIVSTSYGDRIEYNIINESASTGRPEGIRLSSNYTILIGNQINLSRGEAISIGTFNYSAANITLGPDNLVNGLPINYTQHIDDLVYDGIDNDYGQVVCINCKNFTIKNSNLSFNPPTCVVCPNFTFYNNTVNSNGFGLLISLSNYSNVTLNEIRHKAMHGYGINIFSSNFSTIRDNSFATSASRESSYYAHSVYVSSSSGLEIENNFISNTGFRASGIYLASSSNNNVSSNQITISQSDSVNADGTLYISASHNNNFFNNTLNSLATRISGVRFGSATRNNTFENNFIYTKNSLSYPIHINGNSHNFSFVNNVLNNSYEDVHFYVSSTAQGIFNFTNVTREDGSPITVNWQSGANGTLNMHWYLDANVTSSGNALENANVSSYDVNDVLSNTSLTDVQGRTRHVLLEMTMNSSTGEAPTITYYNNYSLNVSKEGYTDEVRSYNLTIEGNVWADVEMGENVPPVLTIISPVNNSKFNSSVVSFDVSGDEVMDWCGLSLDGAENVSMTLNGTATGAGYVDISVIDGNHDFVVYCNDTAGNMATSGLRYFFVDTVYPLVDFVSPTLGDGNVSDDNWIYVNVSSSDTLSNISTFIDWDNSLVSWWRMDDANETHVFDYMGRNNGTIHGDAKQTDDGVLGKAFEFDGSGDYVDITNSDSINIQQNLTVSAWINSRSTTATHFVFSKNEGGCYNNAQIGYDLIVLETGSVRSRMCNGSITYLQVLGTLIDGEWYHITVVNNGTNFVSYLNGDVKSSSFLIGTINNTYRFRLGYSGGSAFNGSIDDVMIFNRSLSAAEIAALYANTSSKYLGVNYTNLQSRNYTFKAYSQDTAGNVNQTERREVTVHLPPALTLTKNATELEHGAGSIGLTWLAQQIQPGIDTIIFNITYPNGTLLFSSSASGSLDLTPANLTIPGIYRISLWANDSLGKTASQTDSFSVYKLNITNCVELQSMNAKLNGNFILMNDINCSDTINWNGGQGWLPVGNATNSFSGSFDGQNYTISGLYINRSGTDYVGLFGHTGTSANLNYVGLRNLFVSGNGFTGGFVGMNRGSIRNSHVQGNVSGGSFSGGFVGWHVSGIINQSYSSGIHQGVGARVGGFVGRGGFIENSYSNMTVTGTISDRLGGFVGEFYRNSITNSYSTGAVYVGEVLQTNRGFAGGVDTGTGYVDENNFWDINTSGSTTSAGNATGKTTLELQNILTFNDTATVGLDTPWDIALIGEHTTETWYIDSGSDYPRLGWEPKPATDTTAPVITILSPLNQTYTNSTIWFNATTDEEIDNWIVNYNGTNVTLGAINTSLEVEDGSYQLLLYGNDASGNWGVNDSVWFGVDTKNYINSCRNLNQENTIYYLSTNVSSVVNCFNVTANNVTLDCGNWSNRIVYGNVNNVSAYYGVYSSRNDTVIRNCEIRRGVLPSTSRERTAIYFINNQNGRIENVNASINWRGVYITNSENISLDNVTTNFNTNGIQVIYSGSLFLSNINSNFNNGISVYFNENFRGNISITNLVSNNNNGTGLFLKWLYSPLNLTNIITNNNSGRGAFFWYTYLDVPDKYIYNLTSSYNTGEGIYVNECEGLDFRLINSSYNLKGIVLGSAYEGNKFNDMYLDSNLLSAIYITRDSNLSSFTNFEIKNCSDSCILLDSTLGDTMKNSFEDGYINAGNSDAIRLIGYDFGLSLFKDIIIENVSGDAVSISGYGLNNIFLNVSYDISRENVTGTSTELIRKWYFDAVVNNSESYLEGARVGAGNVSGSEVFGAFTDGNGRIERQELAEYVNTAGTRTFATPHLVYTVKEGYETNFSTYNLTAIRMTNGFCQCDA